jgi:DNA polymerase
VETDAKQNKKVKVDTERHATFQGVDDLSPFGYPTLVPVRGMKIGTHWRDVQGTSEVKVVVLPDSLRQDSMKPFRPKYIPPEKRMPKDEAERVLERAFPSINHQYLCLLIAARGCQERGIGMPPRIAVDGPSGAGKDATVQIAAEVIGDRWTDVSWKSNSQEFTMALTQAGQGASLVTCSEIVKSITSRQKNALQSLSPLLSFQAGSSVRLLYTGNEIVKNTPVIVLSDTSFPREMHTDVQLGRRFIYVHLAHQVAWHETCPQGIEGWRTQSLENAQAANAIVSSVIDEFFAEETPQPFATIAEKLGFAHLNSDNLDWGQDPHADLLALFHACCHKDAVQAPARWTGRGWKLVHRGRKDPVSLAWIAVCDNASEGFTQSRRVKEQDWARLLGCKGPVECDISSNGDSTVGIRFRRGAPRSPKMRVNEELLRGPDSLPPTPDGGGSPDGGDDSGPPPTPTQSGKTDHPTSTNSGNQAEGTSEPVQHSSVVFIDLETRSRCDLKDEGSRRYAEDPSTEILTAAALVAGRCIAWFPLLTTAPSSSDLWPLGFSNRAVEVFVGLDLPEPLSDALAQRRTFCAHNARDFDARVWQARGLPAPSRWIDTLELARAAGYPGKLDELAQRTLGRGKMDSGKELIRQYSQPINGNFRPLTGQDAARMMQYNIVDVLLLEQLLPNLEMSSEPDVIQLHHAINDRGVPFDRTLAQGLIRLEEEYRRSELSSIEAETTGKVKANDLSRRAFMMSWLESRGVELSDTRRETLESVLKKPDLAETPRNVIRKMLEMNRTATRKLRTGLTRCSADGRLRDQFVYHGAHTGRFSGRGVQPQNLPRPHAKLKDFASLIDAVEDLEQFRRLLPTGVTVPDALSALIRPCFRAAPGHVLLIADYAGIEARGLAWAANETGLLSAFADGDDVYCQLASRLFGRPISKADSSERAVGKQAILGCGYGMSAKRFGEDCERRGVDLAAAGISADQVIEGYRDTYPAIAGAKTAAGTGRRRNGIWQRAEAAARRAIETGQEVDAGRCQFSRESDALVVRLPSGRRLCYRNARIEGRIPNYPGRTDLNPQPQPTLVFDSPQKPSESTYGAKLVENIVQGICRDLLVAAMQNCERAGLPIVLHVHDELVAEVPGENAEMLLRQFVEIMSGIPSWAEGFPVEVEGYLSERYQKYPGAGAATFQARNGQFIDR